MNFTFRKGIRFFRCPAKERQLFLGSRTINLDPQAKPRAVIGRPKKIRHRQKNAALISHYESLYT